MIVLLIKCLSWRHEFLMNNTLTVEKKISMNLILGLLILAFFGHGELLVCHSELCHLVLGLYSKFHDPSSVMTYLKKIFIIFDVLKKIQARIPSVFLLFVGEVFWN